MINECFIHCRGIGPKTDNLLKKAGYTTWKDCLNNSNGLPFNENRRQHFISMLNESQSALENDNIDFFVSKLPTQEHWRILGTYFSDATFFDIETTGLSWNYNHVTVIAAYHKGRIHTFVHGNNLDDFLLLIDDSDILVSFNGNCFDIPFIENTFNIPSIDCPHIDLRWVAYHRGYRGGLKSIEREMGIKRPVEIADIDGFEAVELYYQWQAGNETAKERLINYCKADVISTYMVAARILRESGISITEPDTKELFKMNPAP